MKSPFRLDDYSTTLDALQEVEESFRFTKMRITVLVKPNARKKGVEKRGDGTFLVSVSAPPREGKANEAVIALLACHFGLPKSRIGIVHGLKGKRKIIEIGDG